MKDYDKDKVIVDWGLETIGDLKAMVKKHKKLIDRFNQLGEKYRKLLEENKHLTETNHELYKQLGECNCELCNQCGAYLYEKTKCDGCRWR